MPGLGTVNKLLGRIGKTTSAYGMTKLPSRYITRIINDLRRMYYRPRGQFEFECNRVLRIGQYPELPEDDETDVRKPKKR